MILYLHAKNQSFYAWLSWAAVTDRLTDRQRVSDRIFPFERSKKLGDVLSKEGLIPEIGTDIKLGDGTKP